MGSITITVVGDASVGTKTKVFTVSDADINRLVARAKIKYAPVVNGTPTTAQAMSAMADELVAYLKQDVVSAEKQATVAAVPDPVWTAN